MSDHLLPVDRTTDSHFASAGMELADVPVQPKPGDAPAWIVDRGSARFTLSGEIDAAWMADNQHRIADLLEPRPQRVVVDLEEVTFMDSTGLNLLARCLKATTPQKGEVAVLNPSPMVRKILAITGLDQVVTVEGGEDTSRPWPGKHMGTSH